MSYLVTGYAGLMASRVAKMLMQKGHDVVGFSRSKPDDEVMSFAYGDEFSSKLKIVQGDVLDFDLLQKVIKDNGVNTIIHFAAIIGNLIRDNPRMATMVNANGTLNVFEAARLNNCKVVWSSSSGTFPKETPKIDINSPNLDQYIFYPWGLYGAAKLFGENCATYYSSEFGTKIISLRYNPIMFGPGQKRGISGDVIRELVIKPALGQQSNVPFGNATLDLLYVDDAAEAAIRACDLVDTKSGAYNVGGYFETVRNCFDYVKSLLPEADMHLIEEDYIGPTYAYDTALTKKELGFTPTTSIKDGIKRTINETRKFYNLSEV